MNERSIWRAMHNRCENPADISFPRYGGKGIKVCSEWKDFTRFLQDVGTRPSAAHTLDREDATKDYSKDNCRWATYTEQNNPTRKSVRHDSKTGVTGVCWSERYQTYIVSVRVQGRMRQFYRGPSFETACEVRKEIELKYFS